MLLGEKLIPDQDKLAFNYITLGSDGILIRIVGRAKV
jgi:hypothetical protein